MGSASLKASRSAGVSTTLCRCPTAPQAREKASEASSRGSTTCAQSAGVPGAETSASTRSSRAASALTAGTTCSGRTAA